jgi:hypothetical protein
MSYNTFRQKVHENAPNRIAVPAIQDFTDIARITEPVTTMTLGPLSRYIFLLREIDDFHDGSDSILEYFQGKIQYLVRDETPQHCRAAR